MTGFGGVASGIGSTVDAFKAMKDAGKQSITSTIASVAQMGTGVLGAVGAVATLGEAFGLFGEEAEEATKGADRVMEEISGKWSEWADRLTDTIVEFAKTGKIEFKELVDSILEDILRLTIRYGVIAPMLDAVGIDTYAKGGAFDKGNVIPFARGGVVTHPTLFPMAKGMGLMGEAGPEAVIPLDRMADGSLGVKAAGAGEKTVVNVINNTPAQAQVSERQEDGQRIVEVLIEGTTNRAMQEGRFDGVMAEFGARRRPVRR